MHKYYSNCVYMHGYCSSCIKYYSIFLVVLGMWERERERGVVSEEIIKNFKRMNILLNKCVE